MNYKDKTFCASPNCQNGCSRKISDYERAEAQRLDLPIAYAYFCDIPDHYYQSIKQNQAPE